MISSGELREIRFSVKGINDKSYPFNLPFINELTKLKMHPNVTFFVGENGTGKSTLLEAIAVASGFNAEGGSKNFVFSTRKSHSDLYKCLQTSRGTRRHTDGFFLRAESYFNVATEIEKLDEIEGAGRKIIDFYGGKSLHDQSHGESFWALFLNRLSANGFYILDDPKEPCLPLGRWQCL